MSDRVGLIRAVLGTDCPDDASALRVLDAAHERGIDPLSYCATTLGVGDGVVMARAAAWAGLQWLDAVPPKLIGHISHDQIDQLATAPGFRLQVDDARVLFCAPGFDELLRLKSLTERNPDQVQSVRILPDRALRRYFSVTAAAALLDSSRQNLALHWPQAAAQLALTRPARVGFVMAIGVLVSLLLLAPFGGEAVLLPLTLAILGLPTLLRLAAVARGRPFEPGPALRRPANADLPVYSVLIPLHREHQMVPQLCAAMARLDYPPEKLDIKFVVEAKSEATIEAVERQLEDPRFSLVTVPDAAPRTKPKALDFALPLCRGDFVMVFDAEDTPDPDQLWQAAERFAREPDLHCLQAELYIDNADENAVTGLFAGEYAGLFGVLLPALAGWNLPMPLGGTSNHFRIQTLRALGGWDAYNVTEDADLGMRLARRKYRTATLPARTLEEAPPDLGTWMRQRTRWMKGWMQTFIVHNQHPRQLLADMGWRSTLVFEAFMLGMIIAPLLHTLFFVTLLLRAALGLPFLADGYLVWPAVYFCVLATGYGATLALTIAGLLRQGRPHLILHQVLLPIYWLLMAVATVLALRDLVDRPFHWSKTAHRAVGARRSSGHLSVKAGTRSATMPAGARVRAWFKRSKS